MREVVLPRGDVQLRGTASGSGPTVLLLHAGGEQRSVWTPVAAVLNERNLRTVAYDLRGHGASAGQATTLQAFADDVTAMIWHEPPPLVVVGASLGGLAALAALADPYTARDVAGLILVDVVPIPDSARVRTWLNDRGLAHEHAELVDDILNQPTTIPTPDLPVLLVQAGPDSPLTDTDVTRFRATNPTLTVAQIPTASHLIAHDTPTELAHLIAAQATEWLPS
ncbi:alpha/beta fold hydrolase [Kribbella sp. NPDC051587]|uniref:alpha/beta fold hydrolase n=1 Tax=Kribbella sp. NPDC051587 TaxID=3364119 RepID=UPI0037AD77F0